MVAWDMWSGPNRRIVDGRDWAYMVLALAVAATYVVSHGCASIWPIILVSFLLMVPALATASPLADIQVTLQVADTDLYWKCRCHRYWVRRY